MKNQELDKLIEVLTDESEAGLDKIADYRKRLVKVIRELKSKSKGECNWVRAFDGHFNISCVNVTKERANGQFKDGKWDFVYCPYCGRKIKEIKTGV